MATRKYITIAGAACNFSDDHPVNSVRGNGAPSQADFSIVQLYTTALPAIGQPVAIYLRDGTLAFSGSISEIDWEGYDEGNTYLNISVKCVGFDDRLFHRTTWNRLGFGASDYRCAQYRSWTSTVDTNGSTVTWVDLDKFTPDLVGKTVLINGAPKVVATVVSPEELTTTTSLGTHSAYSFTHLVYCGDAIKDLLDTYADFEGFTYGSGVTSIQNGVVLSSKGVVFDPPIPVMEAISKLLAANPGFFFSVDPSQYCRFGARTLVAAPTSITSSAQEKRQTKGRYTREDVRNVEISSVNWDTIDARQETFTGDGITRSWFLTAPKRFAMVVRVELNGVEVPFADGTTDTPSSDYYFAPGEAAFWQDPALPVLNGGGTPDTLDVFYKAVGDNLIEYVDSAAVTAREAIENAGGYTSTLSRYEESIDRTELSGKTDALAKATASVTRLKGDLLNVDLVTAIPGYDVGQVMTLTIPKMKISAASMFIDSLSMSDTDCKGADKTPGGLDLDFYYTLGLIDSTRRITSNDVLGSLFGSSRQGSGGGSVSTGGGGGITSAIQFLNLLINSPSFPITPPVPTDGALLAVRLEQDTTPHAVVWDPMFEFPPTVDVTAGAKSNTIWMGLGGSWINLATGIMNF